MKRWLLSLAVLTVYCGLAQAHFIWLVPADREQAVMAIFSDSLRPDEPTLLAKIAKTECFLRSADGKTTPVKWTDGKFSYRLEAAGTEPRMLGAVCSYGVIQRGDAAPFMLNYYATVFLTGTGKAQPPASLCAAWHRLPLQVVPSKDTNGLPLRVLWQGKPLADAEAVVLAPAKDKPIDCKSDAQGVLDFPVASGTFGVRVRHVEKKAGKHDGKEYQEVRHYATFVFTVALGDAAAGAPAVKEDSEASKLLAEARAARAQWVDFPGFTADAEVNFDGKAHKGKVNVSAEGKVRFEGFDQDKEMEAWARRTLGSIVGHRLDNSAGRNTPCAFLDEIKEHPQGRAIRVLNDELHSSYRIKDRQITEVNRVMKDRRFTISVLENRLNAEGKFLSVSFVVNYWDLESGELLKSEANHQGWTRVGKFDLPATARVVTAAPAKSAGNGTAGITAQLLTLTNHKLLAK